MKTFVVLTPSMAENLYESNLVHPGTVVPWIVVNVSAREALNEQIEKLWGEGVCNVTVTGCQFEICEKKFASVFVNLSSGARVELFAVEADARQRA